MDKKVKSGDSFCYGDKVWVNIQKRSHLRDKFIPGVVVGKTRKGRLKVRVRKGIKEFNEHELLERMI